MLKRINLQGVSSSDGFIVQFTGKEELTYSESDHKLSILVEAGSENGLTTDFVIFNSIDRWDPPFDSELFCKEKKQKILENIKSALEFLGIRYVIE